MKNIKKLVATLGLLGIIVMTASSAQAGLIMSGRSATPTDTTITKSIFDSIRNIVIGQMTGVTIQDTEGIMFSDQATERTPVYITD